MFGTLRFGLAFMVALSHMSIFGGVNFGVSSVIVFYLLSGYVMTYSFTNNFGSRLDNIGAFYLDRFLRVYPIYLFIIVVTVAFLMLTNFGNPVYNLSNVFQNLTIVPLNYFMYIESGNILQDPKLILIPPAWSLGAEIQFYILIPFLIRYTKLKYVVIIISLIVFTAATFGAIHTDNFGYRLLPGILFIFLVGSLLYDIKNKFNNKIESIILILISLYVVINITIVSLTSKIKYEHSFEVFIGFILGVLLIFVLSSAKIEGLSKKIDDFLGNLSYPLFLIHFLVIWIMDYSIKKFGIQLTEIRGKVILQLLLCVLFSYVAYRLIEVPAQRWRRAVRTTSKDSKQNPNTKNVPTSI